MCEFYRKHNGGGSGINIELDTISIDDMKSSPSSMDRPSKPPPIFAARLNDHEDGISVRAHQLKYRQYDVGNLRKCIIDLENSYLTLNLPVILSLVSFFLDPISLNYLRATALLKSEGLGPFDFRRGLDVEVSANNLCLTLPDSDGSNATALCAVVNLYYSHCWRGFTTAGPGKITIFSHIEMVQMFVAHISNVKESFAKSIMNTFKIDILKQFNLMAPETTSERNVAELSRPGNWGRNLSLSSNTLSIARSQVPGIVQFFDIAVESKEDSKGPRDNNGDGDDIDDDDDLDEDVPVVFVRLSTKDLIFISRAVGHLNLSLKRRISPPSLEDRFPVLLSAFNDIVHLPLPTFYHRYAPILQPMELRSTETNIKPFVLEFVLHNNTYNVDILKASISLRQMHHTVYQDGNHAAFGFIVQAWLMNDEVGGWEPVVESMDVTFVSSLNETRVGTGKPMELLRFDLYALPVDVSISHTGLIGLIRKFSYSDVISTSSFNLPPYVISNKLGVPIHLNLFMGQDEIESMVLQANEIIPIDMETLEELRRKKIRKSKNLLDDAVINDENAFHNHDEEEHRLGISLKLRNDRYESRETIPIDRQGKFTFDMTTRRKASRRKDARDYTMIPCIVANIAMKEDGGRDICLNSIYSIKNDTCRPLEMKLVIKGMADSEELKVGVNEERNIPLNMANPYTTIKIRFDASSEWKEAVPNLAYFIHNGDWGSPKKMRALLCICPPLEESFVRGKASLPDVKSQNWLALFRPEAKSVDGKSRIPVRYPAFDDNFSPVDEKIDIQKIPKNIPIRFSFTAPIQICNAVCQPVLYRFADKDGFIISEGILMSGQSVNVHKIYYSLFQSDLYVSIRIINYCWSSWSRAFSLKHPFKAKESHMDLLLNSMNLIFRGQTMCLPPLSITMAIEENYVIFSCPMILSNRTGLHLDFKEPSESGFYVPHSSQTSAISHLKANMLSTSSSSKKDKTTMVKNGSFDPNDLMNKLLNDAPAPVANIDTDDEDDDDSDDDDDDNNYEQGHAKRYHKGEVKHAIHPHNMGVPERKSSNLVTLFIHMPFDHMQRIDVVALETWTLSQVFDHTKGHINFTKSIRRADYHFFDWEEGRLDNPKVSPPPTVSEDSSRYSDIGERELPHHMKYGILAHCDTKPLSMDTLVRDLPSLRIRLCHVAEWNIYLQVCSIEREIIQNPKSGGVFGGMFKAKTVYEYKTLFFSFDGDVPFNPPRIMGGSISHFNIRVQDHSNWSEDIDPLSASFSIGGAGYISVNESVPGEDVTDAYERFYDLGLSLKKGEGLLQNVVSVTIVPRFILLSKLSFPLKVRQLGVCDKFSECLLLSNSAKAFHFSVIDVESPKLLEAQRAVVMDDISDGEEEESESSFSIGNPVASAGSTDWFGEINICNLGIVYLKLCDPLIIIKVQVEVAGASLIATFSEQSLTWPPYRIDNFTTLNVRFRQLMCTDEEGSLLHMPEQLPWTSLGGLESLSYAWDRPVSGEKSITIDFFQGNDWVSHVIALDSLARFESISFQRNLPDLESNLMEGFLEKYDPLTDTWNQVYCVLLTSVLYMFADDSKKELMGIINLSRPHEGNIQLAKVSKYLKTTWTNLTENIGTTMNLLGLNFTGLANINPNTAVTGGLDNADINRARVLLLKTALQLKLTNFSDGLEDLGPNHIDNVMLSIRGSAILHSDLLNAIVECGEAKNIREADFVFRELMSYGFIRRKLTYNHDMDVDCFSENPSGVENLVDHGRFAGNLERYSSFGSEQDVFFAASDPLYSRLSTSGKNRDVSDVDDDLQEFGVCIHGKAGKCAECQIDERQRASEIDLSFESSIDGAHILAAMDGSHEGVIESNVIYNTRRAVDGVQANISSDSFQEYRNRSTYECFIFCPDLIVGLDSEDVQFNSENRSFQQKATTAVDAPIFSFEDDQFKLCISMAGMDNVFRCDSEHGLFGWIYQLRLGIERTWLLHFRGRSAVIDKSYVTMDSFNSTVGLKVRCDGPTKVLELIEVDGMEKSEQDVNKMGLDDDRDIDLELDLVSNPTKQRELNVSVIIESISLSVVDKRPEELFYFLLHDIQISAKRKSKRLSLALTVQNIQLDNQLEEPVYNVALYPRDYNQSGNAQLLLPGLHQKLDVFPSLHLYFRKRLISTENEVDDEESKNLLYFDIATIWFAPIEVQLDSEIVIRTLRIWNAARNELDDPNFSNPEKDFEDKEVAATSIFTPLAAAKEVGSLVSSGSTIYSEFDLQGTRSRGVYFATLQLHPVDIIMSFKSSPMFEPLPNEDSYLYTAAQLERARLCLNALIAENAFGTTSYMISVIAKHYKNSFFKQLFKLIGSAEIVEGSVGGLIGNLGTGVYDMFYEPIDGLLAEDGSFLEGLGKGGMSLGSKTIGGTAAFASNVTKGIGFGMSFLTMDSEFHKNRARGKLKTAGTISEGLLVGGKELGNNIVEGITGIVTAPYRGFVEEGASGMAKGFAQGILGVALKPAVGVIDAVSRTTEGIKNATFSNHQRFNGTEIEDISYHTRIRIPRTFDRAGRIIKYDRDGAMVQELVNQTFGCGRLKVLHHLWCRNRDNSRKSAELKNVCGTSSKKSWGLSTIDEHIVLLTNDRCLLAAFASTSVGRQLRVIWSCHASCISQLFCDEDGDLICPTYDPISLEGSWDTPRECVIIDDEYKDYVTLQGLCEKTIGYNISPSF